MWKVRLVEELQLAYPQLDKFQIQLVLDFDELMRKKYGHDYDAMEHAKEIFPEPTLDTSDTVSEDGQGQGSETSD